MNGVYCSRSCANSRSWTAEDKKKKSESVKKVWAEIGHPAIGKSGWKHSEEMKQLKSRKTTEYWDKKGRKPREEIASRRLAAVRRYQSRKKDAIPEDADLVLIDKIYLAAPDGYEVDHIRALSKGGLHHQDNLQYLPSLENKRKGNRDKYNESLVIKWQDILS
jgi:5-methylcytosine-specific restriction endonuclease McrA